MDASAVGRDSGPTNASQVKAIPAPPSTQRPSTVRVVVVPSGVPVIVTLSSEVVGAEDRATA